MNFKRLVLFAGHYGSGKTNIAVNMAIDLKKEGKNVVIADLDIVNPYYRTKDSEEELKAAGIPLIISAGMTAAPWRLGGMRLQFLRRTITKCSSSSTSIVR